MSGPGPTLDVAAALRGRTLLFLGATGFVGKVALSLLLHRYPEVGRVFVLVRPGTGGTAEARLFGKVAASRPFDPLRARHGAGFERFLREKCVALAGDVARPGLGLSPADRAALEGLDLTVNCAGLVDFDPSLELALDVNVHGARHAAELCREAGAVLVHVSTCFVAGNRSGVVFEDEAADGYFPRRAGVEDRPVIQSDVTANVIKLFPTQGTGIVYVFSAEESTGMFPAPLANRETPAAAIIRGRPTP